VTTSDKKYVNYNPEPLLMRAFYKRFGDFDRDLGYTYGATIA
jgi:hypothetical protein